MEFFRAFGISWKMVLAQLVNFVVLLFILYKIGYKPLLKFVEERTSKIEKGLTDAKEAQLALTSAKEEQEKVLSQARKEAVSLIEQAREVAKEQGVLLVAKAKDEVADVVKKGKATIEADRAKMVEEVKKDVIEMVALSTKKILDSAVTEDIDKKWLKTKLAK